MGVNEIAVWPGVTAHDARMADLSARQPRLAAGSPSYMGTAINAKPLQED